MTEKTNPVVVCQVVIVEDDDALRRSLQLLLIGQGYDVLAFSRPKAAMASSAAAGASRLVIDDILPESDGIETLRILRACGWEGRAILITAFHTPQLRRFALKAGFAAVLAKPFRSEDLIKALALAPVQIEDASASTLS